MSVAKNDETAAAEKKAAAEGAAVVVEKVAALKVVSTIEGFRRGGLAWSTAVTVVKVSDLSEEQLEQIKGESRLIVVEVEIDAGDAE